MICEWTATEIEVLKKIAKLRRFLQFGGEGLLLK